MINRNREMQCPMNCEYGEVTGWEDGILSANCSEERELDPYNWVEFCTNCNKWKLGYTTE